MKLKQVEIPDGCEIIGSDAFADCENLLEVKLPLSLTHIYDRAFEGCRTLRELDLPKGTRIGHDAIPESTYKNKVARPLKQKPAEHKPLGLFKAVGVALNVSYRYEKTPEHWKKKPGYIAPNSVEQANRELEMCNLIDLRLTVDPSTQPMESDMAAVVKQLPKGLLSEKRIRVSGTDEFSQGHIGSLKSALLNRYNLEETKTPELLLFKRAPSQPFKLDKDPSKAWPRRSFSPAGWSVHI